ncbi:ParB/RepB/Spo0J family partition protein [Brevundimonas sp.]|uniref:ParB/RepB/Spo0J family partition protein n=1 Tax=Brevundimonas sp. TaxID=1871086 RepID=UPI00289D394C|nr:ParB/RepB/Spo0J family partition protein [Brevundimonas sp.]
MNIPIDQISTFDRVRQASRPQVDALVASIREVGLLNPITVAPTDVGFALVAGMHRLEACRMLGMTAVPAITLDLDANQRIIAECDENLCAPTLTASERAEFTRRRKAAYEALHPETIHGAIGGGHDQSRQLGDSAKAPRFTTDTAAATGQSERAVQRDAERGEKVSDEALGMIKGTRLDTGKYLDSIKNLAPEDQVARVEADLSPSEPNEKRDTAPDAPVDPERRKLAKLTTDALIDEVLGLRAHLADEKAKSARLKDEREDLTSKLTEATSGEQGKVIGNLQRQLHQLKGRIAEHQTAAKRWERKAVKAEARVKELENLPIDMGAL